MNIEKIPQYELVKKERIEDIRSEGYLLRHKKSGLRQKEEFLTIIWPDVR